MMLFFYAALSITNLESSPTQGLTVLSIWLYSELRFTIVTAWGCDAGPVRGKDTSGWVWGNPCTGFLCLLPFPGGGHSEHDLFTSSNMHHCGVVVFLSREAPLGLNGWVLLRTNHVDRLPSCSVVKNLPANAGDVGSVPVSGRSLVEENGNPLQYSCLENLMDRGVWLAGVAKLLDTT